jgi:hypothetical protein
LHKSATSLHLWFFAMYVMTSTRCGVSAGRYLEGSTHTNTIEGFFGNLKTGMRGASKKASPHYLQTYLNEYTWRYNARLTGVAVCSGN